MMQFLRLIHLAPEISEIADKVKPVIELAKVVWTDIKPTVEKILNDPVVKSMLEKENEILDVYWLQESLNKVGFVLEVDGMYGKKTRDAVDIYRTSKNMQPTGWADPIMRAALKLDLARAKHEQGG
jgi:hypothetical protein